MSGLSSTLYDTGSIEIIGGHSAAAISGSSISGRALSDVSHGSSAGLRYAEIELTDIRSTTERFFGAGFVDSTASLTSWIGAGGNHGVYLGAGGVDAVNQYVNGGLLGGGGNSNLAAGARICLWLDCGNRKVWVSTRPRVGNLLGASVTARPDLGTGESWTVGGTDPLRLAITPGYGSGSDRNVARLRSRHTELLVGERYGAQPWDAREVTVTGTVNTAHAAVGSTLRWAWFDHPSPSEIVTAPTSVGTLTVGSGGAISASVWTSLDAGGVGSLLLMLDGGDVVAARSHYMPVAAP